PASRAGDRQDPQADAGVLSPVPTGSRILGLLSSGGGPALARAAPRQAWLHESRRCRTGELCPSGEPAAESVVNRPRDGEHRSTMSVLVSADAWCRETSSVRPPVVELR